MIKNTGDISATILMNFYKVLNIYEWSGIEVKALTQFIRSSRNLYCMGNCYVTTENLVFHSTHLTFMARKLEFSQTNESN